MPYNYNNIPAELRALPCWVVWQYEDVGAAKPTKVPYDPKTGQHADVNKPETWATFEQAVSSAGNNGIGFVFHTSNPYAFIDLDETPDAVSYDRQLNVYREFDSYSEVSPSGKGLHIIIKGSVPSGRRRSSIEVYSSQRYATMTGNVYNDKPIVERQSNLTQLWEQMGSGPAATQLYKGDSQELYSDQGIIDQASQATNGQKFKLLHSGRWQDDYPSQSEADLAYINIIAFYTQNRNQIERIFLNSPLGARKKAKRKDYVNWMINKSFDQMLPQIDFEGFKIALENKLAKPGKAPAAEATPEPASRPTSKAITIPVGLMGELAQFIYAAAPRPVPEIALAGAIGLMAGICGRAYNISGTGLNQYILMLAATGSGKESAALGIDRLMNAIKMQVPASTSFIGPSEIASGQALIKHLSKTSQCFVSILGEFGLRLENMSSEHANSAEKTLKRMLLDLFNKSGHGQVFRPSIFADSDKNIQATEAPAFSILGESTPERFYNVLNEEMISEGLLPRFMLIEYNGPRPPLNETHLQAIPPFQLVDKLAALAANCHLIMHSRRVINIQSTPEADKMFKDFDKYADHQINGTNKEVLRQLWNRAHIKALKIAALIAVGVNMNDPIIMPDYVVWAIDMVRSDINTLSYKFEAGEVGTNSSEIKQQKEVMRMIKEYFQKDWEYLAKYCDNKIFYDAKIIPYTYLNKRLLAITAFKLDRTGATNALKRCIQTLIDSDVIREATKQDLTAKFGTTQRAFVLTNMNVLTQS